MKKHIPMIAFFCIIFLYAIVFIYGCKEKDTIQHSKSESITFLFDITDAFQNEVSTEKLERIIGLKGEPYKGVNIHISSISDLSMNNEKVIDIAPTNYLMTNDKLRKENIAELYKNIESEIAILSNIEKKKQSTIFENIALHAKTLSKETSSKKTMYIWSDLRENSSNISLYKNRDIQLLLNNPDEFTNKLIDGISVSDLTGINIYIIYQPKNSEEDKIFHALKPIYEKIFTEHHAHIEFKPNL